MRIMIAVVSIVAVLSGAVLAQDYHVEASRTAIVREEPSADSEMIRRLSRGDQLNAVTGEQTDGFYHVFLEDGRDGWVSRYVVRLYEGVAENAPPVAVVTDVGGGLTPAERQYAAWHLALGKPSGYREIVREGYTACYDPKLKIPVWVQYRLTAVRSSNNTYPRTDDFQSDELVPYTARALLTDYDGWYPRYVRGHMAPADDMRWSESAEEESNKLTNIAPQIHHSYNSSIWGTIEGAVREWVKESHDLTIICGPVFEARPEVLAIERQPETPRQMLYNVIGGNDVAVPTAFFKIIVDMRNLENPDVLAFLVPHIETELGPERQMDTYLVSVDEIEEATGLDFLMSLPNAVEDAVESVTAAHTW
ncbi:DNA/RNA non-specific endonuclease [bacterium]|nr:DNA/RNA non-specific endonuclease [bacterium]